MSQFTKNYCTFCPKNCHQALKNIGSGYGIRDPGSRKNLFRIQGSKRHRIPDPDPQHCIRPVPYFFLSHVSSCLLPTSPSERKFVFVNEMWRTPIHLLLPFLGWQNILRFFAIFSCALSRLTLLECSNIKLSALGQF